MYTKISAAIVGIIVCLFYGKILSERKTIVLNSSKMRRVNGNVIKVENRCYRLDNNVEKCDN